MEIYKEKSSSSFNSFPLGGSVFFLSRPPTCAHSKVLWHIYSISNAIPSWRRHRDDWNRRSGARWWRYFWSTRRVCRPSMRSRSLSWSSGSLKVKLNTNWILNNYLYPSTQTRQREIQEQTIAKGKMARAIRFASFRGGPIAWGGRVHKDDQHWQMPHRPEESSTRNDTSHRQKVWRLRGRNFSASHNQRHDIIGNNQRFDDISWEWRGAKDAKEEICEFFIFHSV